MNFILSIKSRDLLRGQLRAVWREWGWKKWGKVHSVAGYQEHSTSTERWTVFSRERRGALEVSGRNWIAGSFLTTRTKNEWEGNASKLQLRFFCVCFVDRLASSRQRWRNSVCWVAIKVKMFAGKRRSRVEKMQLIKKTWRTRYVIWQRVSLELSEFPFCRSSDSRKFLGTSLPFSQRS